VSLVRGVGEAVHHLAGSPRPHGRPRLVGARASFRREPVPPREALLASRRREAAPRLLSPGARAPTGCTPRLLSPGARAPTGGAPRLASPGGRASPLSPGACGPTGARTAARLIWGRAAGSSDAGVRRELHRRPLGSVAGWASGGPPVVAPPARQCRGAGRWWSAGSRVGVHGLRRRP
jgi:hypothetical protein